MLWLRGLRAGSNRLSVTAQCEYQHTGVGLHRLRDPVDGEVYVYTHFEPFDAHKVLACFDQPDLKAGRHHERHRAERMAGLRQRARAAHRAARCR